MANVVDLGLHCLLRVFCSNILYSTELPHCLLRFFKITGKPCGKICTYLSRVPFKKISAKDLFDDGRASFFYLIFL